MSKTPVIDVHDKLPVAQLIPLGLQHLFAMFGATVLVPILTGLHPSLALLSSGLGTLLFIAITRGQVPAYLGSSFAFIAPIITVSKSFGPAYALGGTIAVGVLYALVSLAVAKAGLRWLDRVIPPVVIGSVIVVIGLGLAPVGIDMAGFNQDASFTQVMADPGVWVALMTLLVTISASMFLRGFFAVVPVLIGVVFGYGFAVLLQAVVPGAHIVDFTKVREAAWFGAPWISPDGASLWLAPKFGVAAMGVFLAAAAATIAEHLGDVFVLSKVVGKEFYKRPGLHRTILGDGLATALAGLVGGPPNTTYGENVGVLAITRVFSIRVIGLAAVFATSLSFVPKLGALIGSIPAPVMGGITIVLFGVIASSGLRTLVESGIDFNEKRNLIIASVILVLGIGGAKFGQLEGMALATVAGIVLNLVLPMPSEVEVAEAEVALEQA